MLLRTLAAAPAKCLRLHGKARIFSLYSAVSARTPKTEGTATPRGKLFPAATCPVPLTAARISSSGRWHPDRNIPTKENRYETHYLRHLDGHGRPIPRGHAYRSRRPAHLGSQLHRERSAFPARRPADLLPAREQQ